MDLFYFQESLSLSTSQVFCLEPGARCFHPQCIAAGLSGNLAVEIPRLEARAAVDARDNEGRERENVGSCVNRGFADRFGDVERLSFLIGGF